MIFTDKDLLQPSLSNNGFNKLLVREFYVEDTSQLTPEMINNFLSGTAAKNIISGQIIADLEQKIGTIFSGKTLFDNTEDGYILGIDQGTAKFYIGNSSAYLNWTGTALIISGTLSAGALDIGGADATSFHVDSDGNLWLGGALFASSVFSVSNAGAVTASDMTITGGSLAGWTLSSTSLSFGAGANTVGLDSGGTNPAFYAGSSTPGSAPFMVTKAGALTASSGVIGGFTITATELYGGIIKTAATVSAGSSGVIMDTDGLRGYDSVLGQTFNLPTDGSTPSFASGVINNTIFEIDTSAILRTSATVGDGSASSAGILINDTGFYACEASQTLANANVKILVNGSAVFTANVKGGQTDYNTGTGYFLGLSGGDYKFSIGNAASNHITWDGTYLKMKGSFEVGLDGLINNSVYTVANLPVSPTVVGFNVPNAYA